ncbi:TonB-dependent receptor [Niabella yanshanensis]|uniref:TonB-dependent receptor n=1 Tax=Niabella yanshanensis TaxID=577386 RepID=A0ABZ0W9K5_9BACT|nr:TonB-dependent receptor [Niabella yanshanensis]WQD39968.1 TonB-dependent receptor [Niabella yanshanensis]
MHIHRLFNKRLLLIITIVCSNYMLLAQQGSLKGKLEGLTTGELPVLNLVTAKDSQLVKTTIPDSAGKYEFNQLKTGNYFLYITHIGYQSYYSKLIDISNPSQEISLPPIQMTPKINELESVKVSAVRPFIQRKIDRVVVNPDALISNAGTTSLDVLEKAPGVLVDIDGNISMKGKSGVVVFIDNKPTYMAAGDLANYLRSLPSGSIDAIELMTTPPAGYDAAGNAGIINIKLKKNTVRGLNAGINLSYGQGKYLRSNNSFNFNYRVNKFNLFSNLSWNQNNNYQDLTINRYYYKPDGTYNSGFSQNSYIKRKSTGQNARVGVDYYMTKKSTIGAVLSGFINPFKSGILNNAQVLNANNTPTALINAISESDRKWTNGSANLNYSYKIDEKGKELTANADYITYRANQIQSLINSSFTPDHSLTDQSVLESTLPATIKIQTAKLDYIHPLEKTGKIELGVKSSFVNTDNTASFFDVVNGISTPNYEFSNRFKYKENINAGYFNYSRDWTKLSLQLGMRLENTRIDGHQLGNPLIADSGFTRNYTGLFPTLYLAYRPDSAQKHQFGFSLGRRIDRPDYQDLNPFTYPIDRFTYYGGNPFLVPTYSYNLELSHTYKNKITTSLEYSIIKNLIQETNEQKGTVYYSRPGNYGQQTVFGLTINGNLQPYKWWTLQVYTEFKNVGFESILYGQTLDEKRWYWYVGPTNQFTITKNLSAELAGSYQTRILSGQFLTIPVWQVRTGLSQKVLKGNGTVRLNLSDAFYTNQPGGDIRNIANSKANWLSKLDSRVFTISFAYRFNKGKTLNIRQSGGSDSEKGRVRTS